MFLAFLSASWADAWAAAITAAWVVRVVVNSSRSFFSSGLSNGTASCGSGAGLEYGFGRVLSGFRCSGKGSGNRSFLNTPLGSVFSSSFQSVPNTGVSAFLFYILFWPSTEVTAYIFLCIGQPVTL
ncbi:hypothetical protein OUZ56_029403 [Daphnia magna]|uniref:Secreted protein n=1 Tax=Daphnia magna TaxID=35525 RepID=A0ABR0B6R6_9CRUS|nr:hypothetical protein OUZ56_029403 [Daphnia magna]